MTKQEVINKIESKKILDNFITNYGVGYNEALDEAVSIVKQFDEPERPPEPKPLELEKPVVPRFVADWIEWCKKNNATLLGAISPIDELGTAICDDKKVESLDASRWATRNQETFAKAWLYGYEIEKEKQYVVAIPDDGRNGFIQLWKNREGKLLFNFEGKIKYGEVHLLTEQEIKQKDERLWKFAEEV